MAVRVFHGDDNDGYRLLIRETLPEAGDLEVVGDAGTPAEIVEGVAALQPDVVLLDRVSGVTLIDAIRAAAPRARVVILSGFGPDAGDPALAAAADAYIVKGASLEELAAAVLEAAG